MNAAGLTEAEIGPLVRAVAGGDLGGADVRERFARAAWSTIAEPGDRDAGELIAAVGAERAWRLLVDDAGAGGIAAAVSGTAGAAASAAADGGEPDDRRRWVDAERRWRPRAAPSGALRALSQAGRFGMRLLVPGDDGWPVAVDDLELHAPFALWVRGDADALSALGASVALVGARAATGYGEHVAIEAASGLVDRGFAIVSGAAYGIDGAAHRAALAGRGRTVAVLAGGLDRFYPAGHEQLLSRIVERGVVVSEVPPGTAPTRWRFLQRNRLIAALADATVVVEAGWRSGSLNTAGHAATLGRPLGAVPGPVTSAASAGCHRLLREFDAVCVTTAAEMAELATGVPVPSAHPGSSEAKPDPRPEPSTTGVRVLDALSNRAPRRIERIAELSGLATDRVRAELGLLELDGHAIERPTGWMIRKPET